MRATQKSTRSDTPVEVIFGINLSTFEVESVTVGREGSLTKREREINRRRSATRARGEHAFHVVKTLWGFAKVRYRGLMKNTARAFAAFALANLYLARRTLLAR